MCKVLICSLLYVQGLPVYYYFVSCVKTFFFLMLGKRKEVYASLG